MPNHDNKPSSNPDWLAMATAPLDTQAQANTAPVAEVNAQDVPQQPAWPATPARFGVQYMTNDPSHPGEQLVVMSLATWHQVGTIMEALRQTGVKQNARIKELLSDVAVHTLRSADAETRLNNLREIRRAEKRVEVEKGLITPGDSRFNMGKKKG